MPFAQTDDGTKLYYEEHGDAYGTPLVLISGQRMDHTTFIPLLVDFASTYRIIVFDNRGTGKSDKPAEPPYTTRGLAADVKALLDHLKIERAAIYGVSMGGRIAQWVGIDYPERVNALVLGCTSPGDKHGIRRSGEVQAIFEDNHKDPVTVRRSLELYYTPVWLDRHPNIERYVLNERPDKIPQYVRELHYQASENHDSWEQLPRINAPTLVLHGSDDRLTPVENTYLLAEKIKGAEFHIIEGGRHFYFLEFRAASNRIVKNFLEAKV